MTMAAAINKVWRTNISNDYNSFNHGKGSLAKQKTKPNDKLRKHIGRLTYK